MNERENKATITSTIRVRPAVWSALRALAELRALKVGGRPSASAVIAELVTEAAAKRQGHRRAD
jgi:hypothetical protein